MLDNKKISPKCVVVEFKKLMKYIKVRIFYIHEIIQFFTPAMANRHKCTSRPAATDRLSILIETPILFRLINI